MAECFEHCAASRFGDIVPADGPAPTEPGPEDEEDDCVSPVSVADDMDLGRTPQSAVPSQAALPPTPRVYTTVEVQAACQTALQLLGCFVAFMEAITAKTFASQKNLQERLRKAIALVREYAARRTEDGRDDDNDDDDDIAAAADSAHVQQGSATRGKRTERRLYTEHDLYILRVAELLVLACVKPQLDRIVESVTAAMRPLFEPNVNYEQFVSRAEPFVPALREILKKKILFWRGRECYHLIDHLRMHSALVEHGNMAMATMKTMVREQIRHDDVLRVLRDLYYSEKFARAILVQRIIELQMIIGGATATSWLSSTHAPDMRERREVEQRTLSFLRRQLRNQGVQTDP